MVFNQVASPRSGIIQNIERISSLGLGTVSDNAAPNYYLDDFLGKVNSWLHRVESWAHEANPEAIFDDINNTGDIPEEFSFTDDTQRYDLDSDIIRIRKVEIRDATTEEYTDLDYYKETDRIDDMYGQDSASPSKYFVQGRELIFDVPIDTALTDKYRLTYDRRAHEFVIGDTTAEPGFDADFHEILYWGAVMDWANGKYPDIYQKCYLKIFGQGAGDPNALKTMLKTHYASQNTDIKDIIKRPSKTYL